MSCAARPFYYLENFCDALRWLRGRYADLLLEEELGFIEAIGELPRTSAALLVRMIMRRGELFRVSKLHYPEIGPTARALPALLDRSWIDPRPSLTLRQLCVLLRSEELQKAFSLRRKPRQLRKSLPQRELDLTEEESRPLEGWWRDARDQVLHVRVARLCQRLRLMFFGNFHQDWSAFVLSDLGIRRYETVALGSASRAFQNRAQIEQLELLYELRLQLREDAPASEVLAAVPPRLPDCDWIEARRARLLLRIGQQSERAGDLRLAIAAYSSSELPEARVRVIRVLERAGETCAAIERLRIAEAASASELERQHAARIRPRLMRRLGLPARKRPFGAQPLWKTFELELPGPDASCSVERLVRDHLRGSGSPVLYVENALISSLFGLLFWPAIFAPVPGAFFHPFQAAPIDLFEPDFPARRRGEIEACFAQLEDGTYRETIQSNLARKAGLRAPFVAWGLITAEILEWALDCVPPAHLRALFSRLLCDLRAHGTGLPDLIQFWPAERRYRMIEVKAPGDRLQDNQIRWLRFCAGSHIPAEVCRVRWIESQGRGGGARR